MNIRRVFMAVILIIVAVIFSVVTVDAYGEREKTTTHVDEEEIQEVIRNYFSRRYSSRQTNHLEDFRDLMDDSRQAESFLNAETDKLAIEIHNSELHHLKYSQYKFLLDFTEITIDKENQTATVLLKEGHDVIFEISEMLNKNDPIISKMRNLDHTIMLRKSEYGWRIVSDHYDDYLWRALKATKLTKEELLRLMDEQNQKSELEEVDSVTDICNLPTNDNSIHPYNREGAVAYAHRYATSPNPAYFYFPASYGDCTNFVNQAIRHGSNAEMVGSNTYGWYYNTYIGNDYSASWADVQTLYNFIVEYWVWDKGPEGCPVGKNSALIGDLIQYNWKDQTPDEFWDHSAIIVWIEELPQGEMYPFIAAHTVDVDNYPYREYIFDFPNMIYRFIRIERIDGYDKSYLSMILRNIVGEFQNSPSNPYPEPMDPEKIVQPMAYPPPYPSP